MQQELFNEDINRSKLSDDELMKLQISLNQEMINYLREKTIKKEAIFIPGQTPALKNEQEIGQIPTSKASCHPSVKLVKLATNRWQCPKCNRVGTYAQMKYTIPTIKKKKRVLQFMDEKASVLENNLDIWNSMVEGKFRPYNVAFYFIRNSLHKFDYINATHIIADMMTKYGYHKDDNCIWFMPEFLGFHVNKNTPGCIFTLMTDELYDLKKKIYTPK